jgi:hypothetical protein
MNILGKRPKAFTITLILVLAMNAMIVALPPVTAHYPPWEIDTWAYISVSPNPVGVGQTVLVIFWVDKIPYTANGPYGDRFTFTVEVTKPDGSKETRGPFTSDPVGGGYTTYTPDQVGTYYFQAFFPEQKIENKNPHPTFTQYEAFVNDTVKASTSKKTSLTVQQDSLLELPAAELPTGYWTRPVDASLREWNSISGNWLNDGRDNFYTTGPKTAHIVWTKPQDFGGLTGGEFGSIGYYEGSSYESKWRPVSIIQGRLYYRTARSDQPASQGTMVVDLRTGEEIMFLNRTLVDSGLIYNIETPNQHGTIAVLWGSVGTEVRSVELTYDPATKVIYDPFTGELLTVYTNVPRGSSAVGPMGELLIYTLDLTAGWMTCWNSTAMDELLLGLGSGTEMWQWRPVGKTVNATTGYEWNVTIPKGLDGIDPVLNAEGYHRAESRTTVLADRIIGGSGFVSYGRSAEHGQFTVWALSLLPGQEGQLLWKKDLSLPQSNMTLQWGDMSLEEGVFVLKGKEILQWIGYDIDTGEQIWITTEPEDDFMMYSRGSKIYNGKLYSYGYAGLYCYDVQTGRHLWTWRTDPCELESAYQYWPLSRMAVADGKLYLTTGEHSHTQPLYRGWSMYCVDAETGKGLWNITGVWGSPILADGYLISLNGMDNRIYSFGKGPTATTVEAPLTSVPKGSSVVIQGTVIDKSAGATTTDMMARYPNGLPAIADVDMTEWMEHVYKQHELPMNAQGVPVTIDAIDPNGNFVHIATVTSDMSGLYSYMWTPEKEGKYTLIATFEGSDSYFASYAETAVAVGPAAAPSGPIEPEPTEAPFITTEIAILIAAVIVALAVIVGFWIIRKRK